MSTEKQLEVDFEVEAALAFDDEDANVTIVTLHARRRAGHDPQLGTQVRPGALMHSTGLDNKQSRASRWRNGRAAISPDRSRSRFMCFAQQAVVGSPAFASVVTLAFPF